MSAPWRRALPFLAVGVVYLAVFPYYPRLRSANEMPRRYLAEEIAGRGTFRLDARRADLARGSLFDVATTCGDPPRPLGCADCPGAPAHCGTPDPLRCRCANQHLFSNKAPGASFLAVPAALALRAAGGASESVTLWLLRLAAATVPALLFLPFLLRLARRFGGEAGGRGAFVAYALGSMALPYALLLFSHAASAAAAGGAFAGAVALTRDAPPRRGLRALGVGALAGAAVVLDYQAVLAVAVVLGYLAWRSPRRLGDGLLALAGGAPFAVLLGVYHTLAFGAPWRTGYAFAQDAAHTQGVLGIVGPSRAAFAQALVAPSNGLLVLMPWALLAAVGGAAIAARRDLRARLGPEALVAGVILVSYVVFLGCLVPEFGRAGWSVGPRYAAVAVPFAAWLAAAGLAECERRAATRIAAHALVLVGVGVYVTATLTYPHWPIAFANPLYEVSVRALREGLAAPSLGSLLGLPLVAGAAAVAAVAVAAAVVLLGTGAGLRRWLGVALSVALAAAVLGAYRFFPAGAPEQKWENVVKTWR